MEFHGTPAELLNLGNDFSEFLQMDEGNDRVDDDDDQLNPSKTAPVKELKATGEEEVAKLEDTSKDKTKDSTFKTYFRSGANFYVLGVILLLFILSQMLASGCDYWVAFWYVDF